MVVVDARGDMDSGIFGEMMLTYFAGLGGEGVVIDGCIRDSGQARNLGVGLWIRGTTPNFHAQTNIFPFAVNVPIACANTFVQPGDIIVADDDGAVVVPVAMAEQVIEIGGKHAEWEEFSRSGCRRAAICESTTRCARMLKPSISPGKRGQAESESAHSRFWSMELRSSWPRRSAASLRPEGRLAGTCRSCGWIRSRWNRPWGRA